MLFQATWRIICLRLAGQGSKGDPDCKTTSVSLYVPDDYSNRMRSVSPTALVRHGVAVVLVGIALFVTTQVEVMASRTPFALFFVAVAGATWVGGRISGIVAFLVGAVTAHYVIIPPTYSFKLSLYSAIQFCVFLALSSLIIWLIETLQKRNLTIVESEKHYDLLFENNPLPMWVIDPKTSTFLSANDAATAYYGYTREEFLGLRIDDLQAPENGSATEPFDDFGSVSRHQRKDGSILYVEVISHDLIFDGRPARMIHTVDVTDRIRASAALQASEARLQKVFGNCPVAMVVNRWSDRAFVDVNAEFSKLTGWTREEVLGRTVLDCDLVNADTSEQIQSYLTEHGAVTDRELEITSRQGEKLRVIVGSVFVEMLGETHVVTTFVNVTERRRAREKQRASEERLQMVTENARVGLVMINDERRYTFANAAYAAIFDLPTENIVGRHIAEIHPTLYEKRIRPNLDRAFAGARLNYELRQPTQVGDRFYEIRYQPTKTHGSALSVIAVVTDVTERRRAELARQVSEERYHTLFEYAPDGIVIADPNSYYVNANESVCRMLGYQRNEMIGLHAKDIFVAKEIPHLSETLSGLNADFEYYQEWQIRRKDGSIFEGEVTANKMPDGNTMTVIRDITERKQLEDQLLQAQKMEAIGVLAGGVAHDFNNILTAISGYCDLALDSIGSNHPLQNYLTEIKDAGNRAAALTGQLLAFSRRRVLSPTIHNLNVSVTDTERMLRRIIKENIEFQINLDSGLGNIRADSGQLAQVLVNLVVNAGDAMPDGGTLTIETRNVYLPEDLSDEQMAVIPGQYVALIVTDTGCGMDSQTQRRLFEPFFTTKEIGRGTGLGLSTVFGIVKQSGGEITVHSVAGKGTTFKVYFPCVQDTFEQSPKLPQGYSNEHGSETILLVEDEFVVRNLVNNVLTQNGYNVIDVDSGEAAIAVCRTYPETIHMLLTDMIMPKMDGIELRNDILEERPNIKVLFMSGYTGDALSNEMISKSGSAFIEKPFTPSELVRKIREELGTQVASPNLVYLSDPSDVAKAVSGR